MFGVLFVCIEFDYESRCLLTTVFITINGYLSVYIAQRVVLFCISSNRNTSNEWAMFYSSLAICYAEKVTIGLHIFTWSENVSYIIKNNTCFNIYYESCYYMQAAIIARIPDINYSSFKPLF